MPEPPPVRCRGIRGATTVAENRREAILAATRELLTLLLARNGLAPDDLTSAFFTLTDDLDAAYPALAARQLGWDDAALLCAREIDVPGGLPRCIRVLLHANTTLAPAAIRHVYLREAVALRPTRAVHPDESLAPHPLATTPLPLSSQGEGAGG